MRLSGRLRRITAAVERLRGGDLEATVPEEGAGQLRDLAESINAMRSELASRIEGIEAERRARDDILSALEEGIVLFDRAGETVYQNPRADRLLGRIRGLRSVTPASLRDSLERVAAHGGRAAVEFVSPAASRTVSATVVAVPQDQVLLVLRDVTEARAADAVRRDFVANASHELKTPAASVQALAETIAAAAGDDPGAIPRFADSLQREAERLTTIVSDLLDLSRLEGATAPADTVRLDRVVGEETDRLRRQAATAGVDLAVRTEEPVRVPGSARDLGLMVRNLVQNAIQYTRPGGSVSVELGSAGDRASLVVADTGIGIPARDRKRVFERFYRVDRARSRETGGTGLGLSIVKHVVENTGGSVTLDSTLGEGSRFAVSLPLAREERITGEHGVAEAQPVRQPSGSPVTPKPSGPLR